MYLGKKVKITRINKGSKYPYAIDATDGTELGWVKLNQLKRLCFWYHESSE